MKYRETERRRRAWWRAGGRRVWVNPGVSPQTEGGRPELELTGTDPGAGRAFEPPPVNGAVHAQASGDTVSATYAREPVGWSPLVPGAPEPPATLRDTGRATSAVHGPRENVHAGLRTRTRVVLVLVSAAAIVTGAVMTAQTLAARSATEFPGTLAAARAVPLDFALAGTVQAIDVVPGQRVTVGEVLATENGASLAVAVRSDSLLLASDEQRLAALLGPAAMAAQQHAAALYQEVEAISTSQEIADAVTLARDQSVLDAAQQAVTSGAAQFTSASSAYHAGCAAAGGTSCARLHRGVEAGQDALARASARATRVRRALAAAQAVDTSLASLVTQEQVLAQQDRPTATAVTAVQVSEARDAVAVDEAKLADDTQSLEDTALTSTVNGVVQAVSAQVGGYVLAAGTRAPTARPAGPLPVGSGFPGPSSVSSQSTGNEPFLTIDAWPGMEAIAQVPEQEITKIRPGQRGTIRVDSLPGRTYRAKVQTIEPVPVDVQGAVYYDVALVPFARPWKGDLLPGMTVNVTLP